MGDLLTKFLILQYVVITVAYLFTKEWAKSIYWFGVIIVTIGVLFMK